MPLSDPVPSKLEMEAVTLEIEGRRVFGPVSVRLDIHRLAIVGRNGSGKSTFSRLLAGLVAPSAGMLRLDGHDMFSDRRAALAKVGILFQNPDHQIIFPTVIEEITFGLTQQGHTTATAQDMARATLARFGKDHWHDAYINTLSQGQKHLLCLMAVAAMGPELLILDEPFAGLDIPTKTQLQRHLELYQGNLIHISHDPQDLMICDRALWIDGGQLRMQGARGTVMEPYLDAMRELGARDDLAHISG